MVERRIELDRRYMRKKKMRKLKAKLGTATGADREKILYKIHRLSPWWTEGGAKPAVAGEPAAPKPEPKPEPKEVKKKAPPKPKAEKKS